ncbi:related to hydrophobin-Laccaria bicolor [Serendipita indica DSM 11827]|uniref:Hydrophobin n=1 Tax=Serendipita indica (strain DSM 11827) TaxID=1109443 RepID=G4TU04_SERID|nr:related to hydrophobin-Laccaria bicolor [Serendipita indica DSM 11827]
MFFTRYLASFFVVAVAGIASVNASPIAEPNNLVERTNPPPPPPPSGGCNVGTAQCCQTTYSSGDQIASTLGGLLGIAIPVDNLFVGVQCSPIVNILGGSDTCNTQAVCCNNNNFNGLINIGCSPISL